MAGVYNADGSLVDRTPIGVAIKAFTFKDESSTQHSFYMGVDTGGLTHTIEVVHVPPTSTLRDLRPLIESSMLASEAVVQTYYQCYYVSCYSNRRYNVGNVVA